MSHNIIEIFAILITNEAELYLLTWKGMYEIFFGSKQVYEITFIT